MTAFLQFLAVTALGLFTAWLVFLYQDAFGKGWMPVAIWIGICLAIGFVIDRHRARKRQQDTLD